MYFSQPQGNKRILMGNHENLLEGLVCLARNPTCLAGSSHRGDAGLAQKHSAAESGTSLPVVGEGMPAVHLSNSRMSKKTLRTLSQPRMNQ